MIFPAIPPWDMVHVTPPMLFKRNYSPSRRSRRQWINGAVQIFSGAQQFSAFGINLSEGGMGFFAAANLRVGSQIAIEFVPPGEETPARRLAKIRHRALYLYGVEFLPPVSQSALQAKPLIAQNGEGKPVESSESR